MTHLAMGSLIWLLCLVSVAWSQSPKSNNALPPRSSVRLSFQQQQQLLRQREAQAQMMQRQALYRRSNRPVFSAERREPKVQMVGPEPQPRPFEPVARPRYASLFEACRPHFLVVAGKMGQLALANATQVTQRCEEYYRLRNCLVEHKEMRVTEQEERLLRSFTLLEFLCVTKLDDYREHARCYAETAESVAAICPPACSTIGDSENALADTCERLRCARLCEMRILKAGCGQDEPGLFSLAMSQVYVSSTKDNVASNLESMGAAKLEEVWPDSCERLNTDPLKDIKNCPRSFSDDPHGVIVYSSEGEVQIGDSVSITCTSPQYQLRSGGGFAYCGYQGQWTLQSLPTCQSFCGKTFRADDNGIVSYSVLTEDVPVGGSAIASCTSPNFELESADNSAVCQEGGVYDRAALPACRAYCTRTFRADANGEVVYSGGDVERLPVNSTARAECRTPHFELSSDSLAVCQADGRWSTDSLPICVAYCTRDFVADPNGQVIYSAEGDRLPVGATATSTCFSQRFMLESSDGTATCKDDGYFDRTSLPGCVAYCTRSFVADPNGEVTYTSAKTKMPAGTMARASCKAGFLLTDHDAEATCGEDGQFDRDSFPTCAPLADVCRALPNAAWLEEERRCLYLSQADSGAWADSQDLCRELWTSPQSSRGHLAHLDTREAYRAAEMLLEGADLNAVFVGGKADSGDTSSRRTPLGWYKWKESRWDVGRDVGVPSLPWRWLHHGLEDRMLNSTGACLAVGRKGSEFFLAGAKCRDPRVPLPALCQFRPPTGDDKLAKECEAASASVWVAEERRCITAIGGGVNWDTYQQLCIQGAPKGTVGHLVHLDTPAAVEAFERFESSTWPNHQHRMFYVGGRLDLGSGLEDSTPPFAFRWMSGLGEADAESKGGRVSWLPGHWIWSVRSPAKEEGGCLAVHAKKTYANGRYVLATRPCDQGGIIALCQWRPLTPAPQSPLQPLIPYGCRGDPGTGSPLCRWVEGNSPAECAVLCAKEDKFAIAVKGPTCCCLTDDHLRDSQETDNPANCATPCEGDPMALCGDPDEELYSTFRNPMQQWGMTEVGWQRGEWVGPRNVENSALGVAACAREGWSGCVAADAFPWLRDLDRCGCEKYSADAYCRSVGWEVAEDWETEETSEGALGVDSEDLCAPGDACRRFARIACVRGCATLHSAPNFQGSRSTTVCGHAKDLGRLTNDVESISILGRETKLKLYKGRNFVGISSEVRSSSADLGPQRNWAKSVLLQPVEREVREPLAALRRGISAKSLPFRPDPVRVESLQTTLDILQESQEKVMLWAVLGRRTIVGAYGLISRALQGLISKSEAKVGETTVSLVADLFSLASDELVGTGFRRSAAFPRSQNFTHLDYLTKPEDVMASLAGLLVSLYSVKNLHAGQSPAYGVVLDSLLHKDLGRPQFQVIRQSLEAEKKIINRIDTMLAGLSGVSTTVPSAAYADAIAGSLLNYVDAHLGTENFDAAAAAILDRGRAQDATSESLQHLGHVLGSYGNVLMLKYLVVLGSLEVLKQHSKDPQTPERIDERVRALHDAWLAERSRWSWLREPTTADFALFTLSLRRQAGDPTKALRFAKFLAIPTSQPAHVPRGNYLLQSGAFPGKYIFAQEDGQQLELKSVGEEGAETPRLGVFSFSDDYAGSSRLKLCFGYRGSGGGLRGPKFFAVHNDTASIRWTPETRPGKFTFVRVENGAYMVFPEGLADRPLYADLASSAVKVDLSRGGYQSPPGPERAAHVFFLHRSSAVDTCSWYQLGPFLSDPSVYRLGRVRNTL